MSFEPRIFKHGDGPRSSKRGAHGPAPARRMRLWDGIAARRGTLLVTDSSTGETLSSKTASQEQMMRYCAIRTDRLIARALDAGIALATDLATGALPGVRSADRRWLSYFAQGQHERVVLRQTAHME